MQDFTGRIAVVTGGGSGIGRALVLRLAEQGCSVATCDIREAGLAETRRLAEAAAPQGVRVTTFVADVTDEAKLTAFRDDTAERHEADHIHLLFNNAGIGGGGSFVAGSRKEWERTFDVCWGGVYRTARVFLPALIRAPQAHLINVSSVNGFWASLGPGTAHTAYSAAKFAVKGFTEALIGDLRINAPHVAVSLVMPGHIGTSIVSNTVEEFSPDLDGDAQQQLQERARAFRDNGLPVERAAEIILEGVSQGRWRILVGPDALALDQAVRAAPETAYDAEFNNHLASLGAGRRS
jgi:NAD(P)-dependent dehydrogenase (short-subunit alcohol dehydrogenase family)